MKKNRVGMPFAGKGIMRVAFAHWKDRLSPVFDVSDRILLIDIENGREKMRQDKPISSRNPLERAKEVSGLGAGILICGAVSHAMETALTGAGVQVMGFFCGNLDDIIAAFKSGQLTDCRFRMPGCRRKRLSLGSRIRSNKSPKASRGSIISSIAGDRHPDE